MEKRFRGLIKDRLNRLSEHYTRTYPSWAEAQKAGERLLKKYDSGERYEVVIQNPDDFS